MPAAFCLCTHNDKITVGRSLHQLERKRMKYLALLAAALLAALSASAAAKSSTRSFPYKIDTVIGGGSSYTVKITNLRNGKVQLLEDLNAFRVKSGHTDGLITLRDYNGDGYPDIAATVIGAYTLDGQELYLYNPRTRQFDAQSGIQTGEIETYGRGCITVSYRDSASTYAHDSHCWRNGQWQPVRRNR